MSGKRAAPKSRKTGVRKTPAKTPGSARDAAAQEALAVRARMAWDEGDWTTLAALAGEPLETCDDRARLALLCAAGLAQLGRIDAARRHVRLARGWGCPSGLMARVLLSGAFNSLGRVASLLDDKPAARRYFEDAVGLAQPGQTGPYPAEARDIREKTALGLLPEAAGLMEKTLERMTAQRSVPAPEASMFKSQMELLNGALRLALRRNQLAPGRAAGDDLDRRATSQLGQDLWVLEQTGNKRGGFFVEFGATDGVLLSNTLLLETEFGWNGICAEPNPAFFAKLETNRACTVAPDCIMGETGGEVDFILADEYGAVAEFADTDAHTDRRAAYRQAGHVLRLPTISLDDFLEKYGAPRQIDYLSIDTEGTEYEILKSFPFDKWDIRLLTVEHNFTPLREDIHTLLSAHGYTRTEMQWDDWYVRTAR